MSKEKKPQTVESLKFAAKENNYKWALALTAIVFFVGGTIMGHFLSVNIINDAQAKVVNSIEISAELKDQK